MSFKKIKISRVITLLFTFIISLAFLSESFAAGGKISGKINDEVTGEPLIGVNVILEGSSMGSASDLNGEYFILNIPPGNYTLVASMIGYKRTIVKEIEVSQNHTTNVDIEMREAVLRLTRK